MLFAFQMQEPGEVLLETGWKFERLNVKNANLSFSAMQPLPAFGRWGVCSVSTHGGSTDREQRQAAQWAHRGGQ